MVLKFIWLCVSVSNKLSLVPGGQVMMILLTVDNFVAVIQGSIIELFMPLVSVH